MSAIGQKRTLPSMMSSSVGIALIVVVLVAGVVWLGISYGANPEYFRDKNMPYALAMRQLGKDKPRVGMVMIVCQLIILGSLGLAVLFKLLSR